MGNRRLIPTRLLPPRHIRREAVELVRDFYVEHERSLLDRAIRLVCDFYEAPIPRIRWKRRILSGKALGLTWDDGVIELIHPRVWSRRRTDNTESEWEGVFWHEMHHHLFWSNAEKKADAFAERIQEE